MRIHVRAVHDGIKVRCDICLKEFNRAPEMRRHLKSVHKVGVPPALTQPPHQEQPQQPQQPQQRNDDVSLPPLQPSPIVEPSQSRPMMMIVPDATLINESPELAAMVHSGLKLLPS